MAVKVMDGAGVVRHRHGWGGGGVPCMQWHTTMDLNDGGRGGGGPVGDCLHHLRPARAPRHMLEQTMGKSPFLRIPISREGVGVGAVAYLRKKKTCHKRSGYIVRHHLLGWKGGGVMFALFRYWPKKEIETVMHEQW